MPVRLETRLRSLGYTDKQEEFETILADVFFALCPDWTDEELLFHPDDAKTYCHAVRCRTTKGLPDELILRALINIRKRGSEE